MCSCHFLLSPSRGHAKPPPLHLSAPHHKPSRPLLILIFIARDAGDSSSAVCLPCLCAQEDVFERPTPQSEGSKLFFSRRMWGKKRKKQTHTFFSENVTRDLSSSHVWNPPQERPYMEPCCLFSHPYKESAPSAPLLFLSNKHKHKGETKMRRVQVAAGSCSFNNPSPAPPSFSVSQ